MKVKEVTVDLKRKKGAVWISENMVLASCVGLTEEELRKHSRLRYRESVSPGQRFKTFLPDTGKSWRYAKINGMYYYDLARIPEKYRNMLPSVEEMSVEVKKSKDDDRTWSEVLNTALNNSDNFLRYYPDYSYARRRALSRACSVLQGAVEYVTHNEEYVRRSAFWKSFCVLLEKGGVSYLPYNWRRFKDKAVLVMNGKPVWEVIDLPRKGNANSLKFDDPDIIAWAIKMRSMPQNYTNAHITRKVRQLCIQAGKEVPSVSWFETLMANPETKLLTSQGRFGKGRNGSDYRGYIPMATALFAGDCWQMDATRINMISHTGENGKDQFLWIIACRDVHSGDILGVTFSLSEDRWGYLNTIRNAVDNTGYLPYEIVFDRFPGHNTPQWQESEMWLRNMGVKITYTSVATGKAKLERWFGTLQSVFMQISQYYYGEGVQSKRKHAHREAKFLNKIRQQAKKDGWNFDAAVAEATRVVEAYRSTKLSYYSKKYSAVEQSPRQLHDESDKPHVNEVVAWHFVRLFGATKQVRIANMGLIKTQIEKVAFTYQVDDWDVISRYTEVNLAYDMEDLTKVYLYDNQDRYLGMAKEMEAAQIYGPDADYSILAKVKQRNRMLEDRRREELERKTAGADEVSLLLSGYVTKEESESAESAWLTEAESPVTISPTPAKRRHIDEEVDIDIEKLTRSQY